MIDEDFWKKKYEKSWKMASSKEEKVKGIIESECNCKCELSGLGAGKTAFLSGAATSRGHEKGESDIQVNDTNICVEVTGPNVDYVGKWAGLWVRPDKIEYAINHPEKDCWVVHVLKKNFYMRAIHLDESFIEDFKNDKFKIVHPTINGVKETYVEIPARSEHVIDIKNLFYTIKQARKKKMD